MPPMPTSTMATSTFSLRNTLKASTVRKEKYFGMSPLNSLKEKKS